jgi:CRP-like cAMP-binding protein
MEPAQVPRSLVRKLESSMLPLNVLEGIGELRRYLDLLEKRALLDARMLGASPADMAAALGMTRQGVYHKLKRLEEGSVEPSTDERIVIPDLEPKSD